MCSVDKFLKFPSAGFFFFFCINHESQTLEAESDLAKTLWLTLADIQLRRDGLSSPNWLR